MTDVRRKLASLVAAAAEARSSAYAPYSKFAVGAAVMGESGRTYTGCNVENASYGLSICAERVAIFKAVSGGETGISAVAVVAGDDVIPRPCGACLQVMQEFAPADSTLYIAAATPGGAYDVYTLDGYLPKPFWLERQQSEQ